MTENRSKEKEKNVSGEKARVELTKNYYELWEGLKIFVNQINPTRILADGVNFEQMNIIFLPYTVNVIKVTGGPPPDKRFGSYECLVEVTFENCEDYTKMGTLNIPIRFGIKDYQYQIAEVITDSRCLALKTFKKRQESPKISNQLLQFHQFSSQFFQRTDDNRQATINTIMSSVNDKDGDSFIIQIAWNCFEMFKNTPELATSKEWESFYARLNELTSLNDYNLTDLQRRTLIAHLFISVCSFFFRYRSTKPYSDYNSDQGLNHETLSGGITISQGLEFILEYVLLETLYRDEVVYDQTLFRLPEDIDEAKNIQLQYMLSRVELLESLGLSIPQLTNYQKKYKRLPVNTIQILFQGIIRYFQLPVDESLALSVISTVKKCMYDNFEQNNSQVKYIEKPIFVNLTTKNTLELVTRADLTNYLETKLNLPFKIAKKRCNPLIISNSLVKFEKFIELLNLHGDNIGAICNSAEAYQLDIIPMKGGCGYRLRLNSGRVWFSFFDGAIFFKRIEKREDVYRELD